MTEAERKKLREAAEKATPELVAALRAQRQLDFDGCEVGVSRQACDEAADYIDVSRNSVLSLIARVEAAEAKLAKAREALRLIAEPSPSAEEIGVKPGFDYWCSVATRRQDRAAAAYKETKP